MKNFAPIVSVLLASGVFSNSIAEERLLPTDQARRINVSIKRDGKAVLALVSNGSQSVVTSAKFVCTTYDTNNPNAKVSWNGLTLCDPAVPGFFYLSGGEFQACQQRGVWTQELTEKLLPGKAKEYYFEPPEAAIATLKCDVSDFRGREKKVLEF